MKKQPKLLTYVLFALVLSTAGCGGCNTQQPPADTPSGSSARGSAQTGFPVGPETDLKDAPPGSAVSLQRNVYMVFDGSGSMADGCSGVDKIDGAKSATHTFVGKIPANVNLGLYVFDDNAQGERVGLQGSTRARFLAEVSRIEPGGGTPLAEAIEYGTDRLVEQRKRQLGYGEYRLVVVTDGEASGLEGAVRYATYRRIPVYTIGLCISGGHPLQRYAYHYYAANNPADLARGLEEATAELPSFDVKEFGKQ